MELASGRRKCIDAILASIFCAMNDVRVRLVRKFAEMIDGVDLSQRSAGQTFRIPIDDARLLIAEGWAVSAEPQSRREETNPKERTLLAADSLQVPS